MGCWRYSIRTKLIYGETTLFTFRWSEWALYHLGLDHHQLDENWPLVLR